MVAENSTKNEPAVPDFLVREIIGGQKFYYRGYKQVISKKISFEAIAYSSSLQAVLAAYLTVQLVKGNLHAQYIILSGNPSLAINPDNQLVCSTLLFAPSVLTPDKISIKYADVPPKIALLMDDKVEVPAHLYLSYVRRKMDALHQFGTEKVILILTASQQVVVALAGKPWLTYDWNESIELIDRVTFNIGQYLTNEGA